jgi:hypothetical protein
MEIAANTSAVPLTELPMPAAVLAVSVGYVSLTLAKLPAWLAAVALHGITGTVRGLGGFRIGDHRVAMPDAATMAIAFAALVVAMVLVWRRSRMAATGLAVLAAAGVWVSATEPRPKIRGCHGSDRD